jgi:hypothetical protein
MVTDRKNINISVIVDVSSGVPKPLEDSMYSRAYIAAMMKNIPRIKTVSFFIKPPYFPFPLFILFALVIMSMRETRSAEDTLRCRHVRL